MSTDLERAWEVVSKHMVEQLRKSIAAYVAEAAPRKPSRSSLRCKPGNIERGFNDVDGRHERARAAGWHQIGRTNWFEITPNFALMDRS